MKILTEPAFPCIQSDEHGIIDTVNPGFTKHQYAAILIAARLSSDYNPNNNMTKDDIAGIAYEISEKVLSYFK